MKFIKMLLKLINIFLSLFNLLLLKKTSYEAIEQEKKLMTDLITSYTKLYNNNEYPAECIIFSMDRALQLHGLLCSYFEKVTKPLPLHILYRSSSISHQKAYEEVFLLFKNYNVSIVHQKRESFKEQFIYILENIKSEKVFFLVDDIIFIEDVDMSDFTKFDTRIFIPSLRMGINLNKSYMVQNEQKLPSFIYQVISDEDKLCWSWKNGELDWGYPLSVDGHLFSTQEILILARYINFNSPNTFEGNLQTCTKYFNYRYGVCYKKSKILNIPFNKVQQHNNNIHGNIHQDYLLEKWNNGMQMDYRSLYDFVNESVHQEIDISFIKRNSNY